LSSPVGDLPPPAGAHDGPLDRPSWRRGWCSAFRGGSGRPRSTRLRPSRMRFFSSAKVVVHRLLLLLPVERLGPLGLGSRCWGQASAARAMGAALLSRRCASAGMRTWTGGGVSTRSTLSRRHVHRAGLSGTVSTRPRVRTQSYRPIASSISARG
jgi:hypothetical protein